MEKIYKTAKWFSEKALQIAEGRREVKRKGEGKIYPVEYRLHENSKEREEDLLQ